MYIKQGLQKPAGGLKGMNNGRHSGACLYHMQGHHDSSTTWDLEANLRVFAFSSSIIRCKHDVYV
jgi:hypothetical protein